MEIDNVLEKVKKHKTFYRMNLLFFSLLINAIIYNMFLLPLNLVIGGTSGIATIMYYRHGVDPALAELILSLICTLFSVLFLDKDKTISVLIVSFLWPLLIKLTSPLIGMCPVSSRDLFIVVIGISIVLGIANGMMYKSGYSNGGLTVFTQILYEKFNISVSKSGFILNMLIVCAGGYYFGAIKTMYSTIILYIRGIFTDKILLGISSNKAFYIITTEEEKINDFIINEMHHTTTNFDVKGAFLEKKQQVILTVIPTKEYYKVTTGIKEIDKDAFFVVTDSYQVAGSK